MYFFILVSGRFFFQMLLRLTLTLLGLLHNSLYNIIPKGNTIPSGVLW